MNAAELWKIFDEECRKMGLAALLFGDSGWPSKQTRPSGPPEDLTLWENILKRVDVRLKSRFSVEIMIDPATGEPVEKGA